VKDKQWDGILSTLKIPADIYPELYSELVPLRSKGGRSERLRVLASYGLMYLRQLNGVQPQLMVSGTCGRQRHSHEFGHVSEGPEPNPNPPSQDVVPQEQAVIKEQSVTNNSQVQEDVDVDVKYTAQKTSAVESSNAVVNDEAGADAVDQANLQSAKQALNSSLLGNLLD